MAIVRRLLALLLALQAGIAAAQELLAVPPLTARVIDQAGLLTEAQRSALANVLKEYEARSGGQIAILLVKSTAPEAIEQYSIRVAEAWKLGRKGVDDGVILLVAKDNPPALRRLRIEAGRGVQGTVTDAQSKRILQDVIAPHFRQDDFYGGLSAGVAALTELIDKAALPAASAPPPSASAQPPAPEAVDYLGLLPLVLFLLIAIPFAILRRRLRGSLSRNTWGRGSGVSIDSGFGSGGFSGFGGDSSSGSDSGFSGGGGSFDGGGASGDW